MDASMTMRASVKRRRGARAIGAIACEVTGGAFARHGLGGGEIAHAWPHIVGHEVAAMSRPERIQPPRKSGREGGTLHILATGPCTIELHYESTRIVEAINTLLGHKAISRLAVRQAPAGDDAVARARPARALGADPAAAAPCEDGFEEIGPAPLRAALARMRHGLETDARRNAGGQT